MRAARPLFLGLAALLAAGACESPAPSEVSGAPSTEASDAGAVAADAATKPSTVPVQHDPTPAPSPDGNVETLRATSLGTRAFSANGRVHPHGRVTRTWFEYGTTTAYGNRTQTRALGPRLSAHYKESFTSGLSGWAGGVEGSALTARASGGATGAHVRFSEPSDFDSNHEDGIGFLQLTQYLHVGTFVQEGIDDVAWGGGDPDVRDAKISLMVRGAGFVPHTAELVFWAQSDLDLAMQNDEYWVRANWAHTGFSFTDAALTSAWTPVSYTLENDTNAWSYGGKSLAQTIEIGRERYQYWPLDKTLRHLNCNMQHVLTQVLLETPPEGAIDFDDFEITYRNHSMLIASNGGSLVSSPAGGSDAAALVDGWRNGAGHTWVSGPSPSAPVELVWKLGAPSVVSALQIHQNPDAPAKDLEVLVSEDGTSWTLVTEATLPSSHPVGANANFVLVRDLAARASYVKVRILSGYSASGWGLGEVEVFGDGAPQTPDDDWYTITDDVTELQAGQTYHYRLVSESDQGVVYGGDKIFIVPDGKAPEVQTRPAVRIQNGKAQLQGRLNPLNFAAVFTFEYGLDTSYGSETEVHYGGALDTPRTVVHDLSGLEPGKTYHYRLVVRPDPDRPTRDFPVTYGVDATFVAK